MCSISWAKSTEEPTLKILLPSSEMKMSHHRVSMIIDVDGTTTATTTATKEVIMRMIHLNECFHYWYPFTKLGMHTIETAGYRTALAYTSQISDDPRLAAAGSSKACGTIPCTSAYVWYDTYILCIRVLNVWRPTHRVMISTSSQKDVTTVTHPWCTSMTDSLHQAVIAK